MMMRPVALQPPHFARELIPESSFSSCLPTIHHPMYDHDSNETYERWDDWQNVNKMLLILHANQVLTVSVLTVYRYIQKIRTEIQSFGISKEEIVQFVLSATSFFGPSVVSSDIQSVIKKKQKPIMLTNKNYSRAVAFMTFGDASDTPPFHRMMTRFNGCANEWISHLHYVK